MTEKKTDDLISMTLSEMRAALVEIKSVSSANVSLLETINKDFVTADDVRALVASVVDDTISSVAKTAVKSELLDINAAIHRLEATLHLQEQRMDLADQQASNTLTTLTKLLDMVESKFGAIGTTNSGRLDRIESDRNRKEAFWQRVSIGLFFIIVGGIVKTYFLG